MSLLQHTAKQCNTECLTIVSLFQEMSPLQHTPTHSNTLQHTATLNIASLLQRDEPSATHCSTLQHTATHCNTERLTKASLFQRDQPVATHCNTLQHTATHCNTECLTIASLSQRDEHDRATLQHTATHCNTLQHTATPSYEPDSATGHGYPTRKWLSLPPNLLDLRFR